MKWTEELDNALRKGHEDGLSAQLIAERLGNDLTRNAILGRTFRLGIMPGRKPLTMKPGPKGTLPAKRGEKRTKRTINPELIIDHIMDYKDMGLTWNEIGAIYNTSGVNARRWAIDYGNYQPPKMRFFTTKDEEYLVEAWNASVPVEDIADKLGRSFGTIRQKILGLKRKDVISTRDPNKTRLLRMYGEDAVKAGATPTEALINIRNAKAKAYATALQFAKEARNKFKKAAIGRMNADIANGMERNEAIFIARSEGVTLNELAEEFDVTREGIRQICIAYAELVALKTIIAKEK